MKTKYDVVVLGAGHNGLVATAYLARAGLSALLLEKNDYIGGATTSQKVFRDYDAYLSRYSYLVSWKQSRPIMIGNPEVAERNSGDHWANRARGIANISNRTAPSARLF